ADTSAGTGSDAEYWDGAAAQTNKLLGCTAGVSRSAVVRLDSAESPVRSVLIYRPRFVSSLSTSHCITRESLFRNHHQAFDQIASAIASAKASTRDVRSTV